MINFNVKTSNDHDRQIIKKDVSLVEKMCKSINSKFTLKKNLYNQTNLNWIIENVAILEVNVSTASY